MISGSLWLFLSAAWAGPDEEIDTIEAAAADVDSRSSAIGSRSGTGIYLSPEEAVTRFQDYLFLHLIGQDGPAAEGFFALVTTGALNDLGMHRDAEWYLAECLVGLGNLQTAAGRFRVIVDEPGHPFHDDAVRKLLELHAAMDDKDAFKALYDAEIVTGKVKSTGLITYSLAKSFHQQGDAVSARQYFQQVPADNEWYGRARYFGGVMDVEAGNLDAAVTAFTEVAAMPATTIDDRRVHDLALLALGRIAYQREDYPKAYEAYTAIAGDSEYQDQKLYETIWTSIRRKDWRDALNNVEIFLLAYPDHQYAAQLRLLQGHLNFQDDLWPDALSSYQQVIEDYQPIRERFTTLATPGPASDAAIEAFLRAGAQAPDLPEYAVALMRRDAELGRTMRVFTEMSAQRSDLELSESLVEEIRAFILGSGASSSYERMTMDGHYYRSRTLGLRLSLLEIEERWLADTSLQPRRTALTQRWKQADVIVAGSAAQLDAFERSLSELRSNVDNAQLDMAAADRRIGELEAKARIVSDADRPAVQAEIDQARAQHADAAARITEANRKISEVVVPDVSANIPAAELTAIAAEVDALAKDYAQARPAAKASASTASRADAAHRTLVASWDRLGAGLTAIEQNAQGQLGEVRQRFETEVANVAQERVDYERTSAKAHEISLDVTRQGFGRLEDFFAESILKADIGIVDVYWAQKLDTDDELTAVRTEKDATLAELDRRFRLIREKLGER